MTARRRAGQDSLSAEVLLTSHAAPVLVARTLEALLRRLGGSGSAAVAWNTLVVTGQAERAASGREVVTFEASVWAADGVDLQELSMREANGFQVTIAQLTEELAAARLSRSEALEESARLAGLIREALAAVRQAMDDPLIVNAGLRAILVALEPPVDWVAPTPIVSEPEPVTAQARLPYTD